MFIIYNCACFTVHDKYTKDKMNKDTEETDNTHEQVNGGKLEAQVIKQKLS